MYSAKIVLLVPRGVKNRIFTFTKNNVISVMPRFSPNKHQLVSHFWSDSIK
jgi:hypothetical protein